MNELLSILFKASTERHCSHCTVFDQSFICMKQAIERTEKQFINFKTDLPLHVSLLYTALLHISSGLTGLMFSSTFMWKWYMLLSDWHEMNSMSFSRHKCSQMINMQYSHSNVSSIFHVYLDMMSHFCSRNIHLSNWLGCWFGSYFLSWLHKPKQH